MITFLGNAHNSVYSMQKVQNGQFMDITGIYWWLHAIIHLLATFAYYDCKEAQIAPKTSHNLLSAQLVQNSSSLCPRHHAEATSG